MGEDANVSKGSPVGRAFARALAVKDFDQVADLLHPEVDFRAVTPGRSWEASGRDEVIEGVLRHWFEETDEIDELVALETDAFSDRERVGYRFRGHNPDGPFLVEQQAYLELRDEHIAWLRITCSGFRPLS